MVRLLNGVCKDQGACNHMQSPSPSLHLTPFLPIFELSVTTVSMTSTLEACRKYHVSIFETFYILIFTSFYISKVIHYITSFLVISLGLLPLLFYVFVIFHKACRYWGASAPIALCNPICDSGNVWTALKLHYISSAELLHHCWGIIEYLIM